MPTEADRWRNGIVGSYNPTARRHALQTLRAGGNAFDAFVVATFVECVSAPGTTSLAGSLAALVFDANEETVHHLDADFNDPRDAAGAWSPGAPCGRAALVPGIVAGLDALLQRYGSITLTEAVGPAIEVAERGLVINDAYAAIVESRRHVLEPSAYARSTLLHNDGPVQPGVELRQPEVARFLAQLAAHGTSYVYGGAWGDAMVAAVRAQGGLITSEDLTKYRANWIPPRTLHYREYDLHTFGGRTFGGLSNFVALRALEPADLQARPHATASADTLEVMVRVSQEVAAEEWLFNFRRLDDAQWVRSKLAADYARELWHRAQRAHPRPRGPAGHHSYHLIVVDKLGNAVAGTHTIASDPWGDGLFVEGVPLTNAGTATEFATAPGERRLSGLCAHLGLQRGQVSPAAGTFHASLLEAGLQFVVNAIAHRLSPAEATGRPRFGMMAWTDDESETDPTRPWLDPAYDPAIVTTLHGRGLEFVQTGEIDTGHGVVLARQPDGSWRGAVAALVGHDGGAEGY